MVKAAGWRVAGVVTHAVSKKGCFTFRSAER